MNSVNNALRKYLNLYKKQLIAYFQILYILLNVNKTDLYIKYLQINFFHCTHTTNYITLSIKSLK